MKFLHLLGAFILAVISCQAPSPKDNIPAMIDYIEVADIIHGLAGPLVLDLKSPLSGKQVVVVGCPHSRDTTGKEFELMEVYFRRLRPDIAFNEGGPVSDSVHFSSRSEAILREGETGYLKFLCDKAGINMVDGDLAARDEFAAMLQDYPQEDLFLYYTIERFMWPAKFGANGDQSFESAYNGFINDYLIENGFPLKASQKSLTYFQKLYSEKTGQSFDRDTFDISRFNFLSDNGKYCELGRASKVIRDKALLKKIENALERYDRIFVAFGGAHVIAFEPALKQLVWQASSTNVHQH